ncbi:MAG: DUF5989 family protein [Rubripirellula sp.]
MAAQDKDIAIEDSADRAGASPECSEFEKRASEDPGLIQEFASFLRHNKKWWLAPILIVVLLLTCLVFLAASPAAPFIYTLF